MPQCFFCKKFRLHVSWRSNWISNDAFLDWVLNHHYFFFSLTSKMIKRICFILEELCHFFIKRLLTWTLDNGHLDNSINMECFQQVWKHQDLDSFAKVGTFTSENNFPLDSSPLNCTLANRRRNSQFVELPVHM